MALKIEQELRTPFSRYFDTQAGELGARRLADTSSTARPTSSQVAKTPNPKFACTDKRENYYRKSSSL